MSNEKEIDYQAYIDALHEEIEGLKGEIVKGLEIISEQAKQLDAYETAMINAFVKWGASR